MISKAGGAIDKRADRLAKRLKKTYIKIHHEPPMVSDKTLRRLGKKLYIAKTREK